MTKSTVIFYLLVLFSCLSLAGFMGWISGIAEHTAGNLSTLTLLTCTTALLYMAYAFIKNDTEDN